MRKTRTYVLWFAVLWGVGNFAMFRHAALPVAEASDGGAEPAPNAAPSRWVGDYKVTGVAPRGVSTLTTNDAGTLQFTVNGIQVRGTLKGHVEAKMTGMFSMQGASDYTATLVGIVRKASELPNPPKGLSTSGEVVTVNAAKPTPSTFPMSGVEGTPPYTHPYNVQHPTPNWPLIILLGDGRTTEYDVPPIPMVPDTVHVKITIHQQP
jgi:hypothetical protein